MKRWNRAELFSLYPRKFITQYEVLATKTIIPIREMQKWDWVSQQILKIGSYYEAVYWLIDNFYSADTVVTGRTGSGKTSVMLKICEDMSAYRDVPFTVKDNVFTGRIVILTPELIHDELPPYSVRAIDEIQHAFHKMRSMSRGNVEANKFMDLKRKWKQNVVGTMPHITSVDKDLVNEKIVFWINCYFNSKKRKYVKAVVWVNLTSKDGKFRDFVKLEERKFEWCGAKIYAQATKKWEKEQGDVENLEDFTKRMLKKAKTKLRREQNERIREILEYEFLSDEEKCYLLLDMEVAKVKIQEHLSTNKKFVYACENDLDLYPEKLDETAEKIEKELEKRERET